MAPSDALLHQTGPGCISAAPSREPCGFLKGALRLYIYISNIYWASPVLHWMCDHERRRNEIRRRVRKSYGARWICESPFTQEQDNTHVYACVNVFHFIINNYVYAIFIHIIFSNQPLFVYGCMEASSMHCTSRHSRHDTGNPHFIYPLLTVYIIFTCE